LRLSSGMDFTIEVSIRPGATALTRMFIGASSLGDAQKQVNRVEILLTSFVYGFLLAVKTFISGR
jgi:hypothetical protein